MGHTKMKLALSLLLILAAVAYGATEVVTLDSSLDASDPLPTGSVNGQCKTFTATGYVCETPVVNCPAGKTCSVETLTAYKSVEANCPAGKYSPSGVNTCSDCPAGRHAPAGSDDQQDCVACAVGKFAAGGG